jgi:hypothetical protein
MIYIRPEAQGGVGGAQENPVAGSGMGNRKAPLYQKKGSCSTLIWQFRPGLNACRGERKI